MAKDVFEQMAEAWPSEIVARGQVGKFSGGLVNPRALANLDSQGRGPARRIKLGERRVAYPVHDFVCWLRKRCSIIENEGKA